MSGHHVVEGTGKIAGRVDDPTLGQAHYFGAAGHVNHGGAGQVAEQSDFTEEQGKIVEAGLHDFHPSEHARATIGEAGSTLEWHAV